VGEHGELLNEEAIRALELLDDPEPAVAAVAAQCSMLSAQAESSSCIRLTAKVQEQTMLILLDSGSSHSFVSASFCQTLAFTHVPLPPVLVKVANGQFIICDSMVSQLEWSSQGHNLKTDLRVLDIGAYDAVLGMDWLDEHSLMSCQWHGLTMKGSGLLCKA
jgi:hypothetical protein